MEGLIGARTNMDLTKVPMRVYKEARLRNDYATMERSMGYVKAFESTAYDYKDKADEGMEEETRENKEQEKLELQQDIEEHREERKELEEQAEAKRKEDCVKDPTKSDTVNATENTATDPIPTPIDTIEISPAGKALLDQSNAGTQVIASENASKQPILYSSAKVSKKSAQNNISALSVLC